MVIREEKEIFTIKYRVGSIKLRSELNKVHVFEIFQTLITTTNYFNNLIVGQDIPLMEN